MAYDTLKTEIRQYIQTNGQQEITGQILQNVLLDMVNAYPSLDGYATQQWVQNQGYVTASELSVYATQSWVNTQLGGYLPLTGGNLDGNLSIYDTMNIYSSSIEWNDDGDYSRITFDDDGITVTAHGTGYVIANEFIRNGGTSSQFLKADGSVDNNTYLSSADLSGYATETWVGNNYLPLTGGNLNGNLSIYGTMNIYSSSIEWNDNGDYCRISFDDDGITVTAHGTGYVIANEFIRNGGTSAQFLKADGSVDSNTYLTSVPSGYATETWVGNNYLPLTGGTITGNISVLYNLYVGTRLTISAEGGTPEDPESFEFWLDNGEINIDNQTVITRTNITANAFIQGSDITKKNIIGNVGLSLHDVANAPLFDFTWKDSKDQRNHVGTSAQYWQTVIPEVVSEDKRGVLGLQYDVAALAGVITVAKRVVDHEDRISAIERKLNIN